MTLTENFDTPFGVWSVAATEDGAVLEVRFGPCERPSPGAPLEPALRQLREYFAGERREFELALAPACSAFQARALALVAAIPFGSTRTYGELAVDLGSPKAARAVGRANATNPIPLIIPCHRVLGAEGRLTGYGGGLEVKARLLEFEGVSLFGHCPVRRFEGPRLSWTA